MNEHDLRTLLIRATEDRPAGIQLMPATTTRKRRLTRVLVPAIASLGVAAAVVLVIPGSQPSAQAQVAAAIETTSQESYRIHVESGAKTFDGAFDPAQRVGVVTSAGDGAETRFIDDQMYVRPQREAKWTVYPRSEAQPKNAPAATLLVKLAPQDPQAALQQLRSATDVRERGAASGDGWTGQRFTFSLKDTGAKSVPGQSADASGAVDVDDQGRVRRLEVIFGDTGHRNVMNFVDYGTPVSVTAPPADQVEHPPADKGIGKKP